MIPEKALFISGSIGLGHVIRDLAIARKLRNQYPGIELFWLAASPASSVIKDSGEKLLPEAESYSDENVFAEDAASGSQLNLLKYLLNARPSWDHNAEIYKQVITREKFDLIIADEAYEIVMAWGDDQNATKTPFVMIYDFLGLDSMTINPIEKLGIYFWNRLWSNDYDHDNPDLLELFIGELEDIPDRSFGFRLPNRRDYARKKYKFLGYVLNFDVEQYTDKAKARFELGYGDVPLVVCSIGGTTIGKNLLELCGSAYQIVKEEIPDLEMILVCGPRLSEDSLTIPEGVKVFGYLPDLFKHFAASDLAIVQGGGNTTLELTALRRPFIYFPLEQHFEQQIYVAGRLERQQVGIKMTYSRTAPDVLAGQIIDNIGKEVTYPPIPSDGDQKAVQYIDQFLSAK